MAVGELQAESYNLPVPRPRDLVPLRNPCLTVRPRYEAANVSERYSTNRTFSRGRSTSRRVFLFALAAHRLVGQAKGKLPALDESPENACFFAFQAQRMKAMVEICVSADPDRLWRRRQEGIQRLPEAVRGGEAWLCADAELGRLCGSCGGCGPRRLNLCSTEEPVGDCGIAAVGQIEAPSGRARVGLRPQPD